MKTFRFLAISPERPSRRYACRYRLLIPLLVCAMLQSAVFADERESNELVRMFAWWNEAILQADGFTEAGFARHFTADASIIVNNTILAKGVSEMVRHFRQVQKNTESVEIILPFEEGFREGNKIFTHHRILAVENGRNRQTHVMGYALIDDGRISLINFISHSE